MDDLSFLEFLRLDFPDLFKTQSVRLRLAVAAEIEFLDDLLGQTTMTTLSKESDSSMKLHTALERRLGLSTARNAQIICSHTLH